MWKNIEIVKRNGEGTGKQRGGGGTCVVMAQWDHYCNAASIPSLRTDLFLLFLSFSLSFFLLLPFPPIRIFVAFISLVLSFLRNFRYALKARRAFARLGFAQLVTMRRLQGICRIKNFRGTRRWTKARWCDQRRFWESKGRCVDTGYIPFYRHSTISALHSSDNVNKFWDTGLQLTDLSHTAGKVYNANENALQNPCKNNAVRKIVRVMDIRATFPLHCVSNHAVGSNHKYSC